jgi:hypothetical protein
VPPKARRVERTGSASRLVLARWRDESTELIELLAAFLFNDMFCRRHTRIQGTRKPSHPAQKRQIRAARMEQCVDSARRQRTVQTNNHDVPAPFFCVSSVYYTTMDICGVRS